MRELTCVYVRINILASQMTDYKSLLNLDFRILKTNKFKQLVQISETIKCMTNDTCRILPFSDQCHLGCSFGRG